MRRSKKIDLRFKWRPTEELASTSVLMSTLLIGATWFYVIPKNGMVDWIRRLASPFRLIPMLFRFDLNTGNHANRPRYAIPAPFANVELPVVRLKDWAKGVPTIEAAELFILGLSRSAGDGRRPTRKARG